MMKRFLFCMVWGAATFSSFAQCQLHRLGDFQVYQTSQFVTLTNQSQVNDSSGRELNDSFTSHSITNLNDTIVLIELVSPPPSPVNVRMKLDFEQTISFYVMKAALIWDLDTTGLIQYYKVFIDGDEFGYQTDSSFNIGFTYFSPNFGLPQPLDTNVYHQCGIIAVDIYGVASDTTSFHFYFAPTGYSHPQNLNIVNNLEEGTANFSWNIPPYGGGENQPQVANYSVYLNGNFVNNVTDTVFTFTGLTLDNNYVAGVIAHYSDGYSDSTFYPNYAKKEFYFNDLSMPENLMIDESTGDLSWRKPNCDENIIGGTFFRYPAGIFWNPNWFNPDEEWAKVGDSSRFVNSKWYFNKWIHNDAQFEDVESITFGQNFYHSTTATNIKEVIGASGYQWVQQSLQNNNDANTNNGIGAFVAHYNADSGYYGVIRVDDIYNLHFDGMGYPLNSVNYTWWVQTNHTDDFSQAYNYYPDYYLIYLDGQLMDTLIPGYEEQNIFNYKYHFEGLIPGQNYSVGIEAVYYVGTSDLSQIQFNYLGTEELQSSKIKIYPNPASDVIHIEVPDNMIKGRLINNLGRIVSSFDIDKNKTISLSTTSLNDGCYFIQLIAKNGNTINRKVFVTK